jgi:hypothetical protein
MQLGLTELEPSSELHCQNLYVGFLSHDYLQQAHSPRWQIVRKHSARQVSNSCDKVRSGLARG